jgi:hypothetical protein
MTLKSLAMSITTLALAANATWPEFTVPNFYDLAEQFAASTEAETVFIVPVIVDETRELWNKYSTAPGNMDWYKEGLQREGKQLQHLTDIQLVPTKLQQSFIDKEDNSTHYLPLWQSYPTPHSVDLINHNLVDFSTIDHLLHHVLDEGEPALSRVFVPCLGDDCPPETFYGPILSSIDKNTDHTDQPHIMLLQPITAGFDHGDENPDKKNEIVAIVGGVFQLDTYLKNVLHEGANGIEAVVRNTCEDAATFELNGDEGE